MKNITGNLLALQNLQLKSSRNDSNRKQQIETLRQAIPENFLRTFDSFVGRQKKPVAVVRHGVCGECHLGIARGILGSLLFGEGVHQCGNCGRFLYLPEDEPAYGSALTERRPSRPTRPTAAAAKVAAQS